MRLHRGHYRSVVALVVAPLLAIAATQAGVADGLAGTRNPGPAGLTARLRQRAAQLNPIQPNDADHNETDDLIQAAQEYTDVRTAPATSVSSQAFTSALQQAAALRRTSGTWSELTTLPYNSDAVNYRDPVWSNSSGGNGLVTGRMTSIAVDGATVYAGAADGGVWRTDDAGATWTPLFDQQGVLAVGAVAVNPADHSVWVGTGEANFNYEAYAGAGIYRSSDRGATWQLVGGALDNSLVSNLAFDGAGSVYASTSSGLLQHAATASATPWTVVLKPDPNPNNSPYRNSFFTDVKVRPGTGGQTVLAPIGWRGGTLPADTSFNGFYQSTTGGGTGSWTKLTPTGALAGATNIGRTTFSWSANGAVLYAVIESTTSQGLKGVYKSANGDPTGPWTLLANSATLANAGSALALSGGAPGGQAWYDQYVLVDPSDANHVYAGLEEVFETSDGGATWATPGPYWNFPFPCWSVVPAQNTCPNTIHPDQHAAAFGANGQVYFGSDGGMWRRAASDRGTVNWADLNATLRTLQYYSVGAGTLPNHGGTAVWGGLQDNGTSLQQPGQTQMVSPFGGDGGVVLIDPNNGNRAVNEYTNLSMASTTNGGQSDGSSLAYNTISPSCLNPIFTAHPCDPNTRFIAPYSADVSNVNHWVAGGQYVWDNQGLGWDTNCSSTACDWQIVHDTGTGHQMTAVGASGPVTYAGWCGGGGAGGSVCTPGTNNAFISGIDTNYGGSWHRVTAPNLPNRIVTSFLLDPANPGHVVVTYGAFSRRWVAGGGVGHVFESTDGGTTWADVSGNLPDAPVNSAVLWNHNLVVGTDVGVFLTVGSRAGDWRVVGQALPNASTNQLAVTPDGTSLIAATHGRGMWSIGSAGLR